MKFFFYSVAYRSGGSRLFGIRHRSVGDNIILAKSLPLWSLHTKQNPEVTCCWEVEVVAGVIRHDWGLKVFLYCRTVGGMK
jgi:hypothetical protein